MTTFPAVVKHTNLKTNEETFSVTNFTSQEINSILENNLQDFEKGKTVTLIVGNRKTEIRLATNRCFE